MFDVSIFVSSIYIIIIYLYIKNSFVASIILIKNYSVNIINKEWINIIK